MPEIAEEPTDEQINSQTDEDDDKDTDPLPVFEPEVGLAFEGFGDSAADLAHESFVEDNTRDDFVVLGFDREVMNSFDGWFVEAPVARFVFDEGDRVSGVAFGEDLMMCHEPISLGVIDEPCILGFIRELRFVDFSDASEDRVEIKCDVSFGLGREIGFNIQAEHCLFHRGTLCGGGSRVVVLIDRNEKGEHRRSGGFEPRISACIQGLRVLVLFGCRVRFILGANRVG